MAEEGKGVAMAILGIVAVIAVVGLVLLFTGATGKVSAGLPKVYGGVHAGEEFPYLTDRSQGGYPQTAGQPDAVYYPEGFYTEKPVGVALQEDAPFYGESVSGTREYTTFNRQPYYVPSGQLCWDETGKPGFRCPQGTTCIENMKIAEGGGWVPAPAHPCYVRASQAE
ncbi:MAG: hypothetical protein QXR48_03875 [Candidatus Woesearchaeota archaeon]